MVDNHRTVQCVLLNSVVLLSFCIRFASPVTYLLYDTPDAAPRHLLLRPERGRGCDQIVERLQQAMPMEIECHIHTETTRLIADLICRIRCNLFSSWSSCSKSPGSLGNVHRFAPLARRFPTTSNFSVKTVGGKRGCLGSTSAAKLFLSFFLSFFYIVLPGNYWSVRSA
jgi:hypothetical protein